MPTTGTIPLQNVIPGQTITDILWNTEFANIGTLLDAQGAGGYSATDPQMQVQTDPYPGSVTSRAASIAGELERLRYMIAQITGNTYWYQDAAVSIQTAQNSLVPVGGVIDYPSATAPNSNWHLADGTAISRTLYSTLYSLIGTTFGSGDGSTTFNLPNYKDRMSIGAGNSYALAATGGATSNTPSISVTDPGHTHTQNSHTHTMGNHTHSTPSHTHVLGTAGTIASKSISNGTANSVGSVDSDGGEICAVSGAGASTLRRITNQTTSGGNGTSGTPSTNTSDATTATNNSATTGVTASSSAIPTLPPYLGMYKMIRVV